MLCTGKVSARSLRVLVTGGGRGWDQTTPVLFGGCCTVFGTIFLANRVRYTVFSWLVGKGIILAQADLWAETGAQRQGKAILLSYSLVVWMPGANNRDGTGFIL